MPIVTALIAGTLFGAGLTISQMVDPRKVLDFLDLAAIRSGTWDPTLLVVFGGALATMFVAYSVQRRMRRPVLASGFAVPIRSDVDARLIAGSAVFGIGWGLVGVCPGPAVTALALAGSQVSSFVVFIAAMVTGILLSRLVPANPRVSA